MNNQQRKILTVLASQEEVPLYLLLGTWVASHTKIISQLRDPPYNFKIPAPKMEKNREGNLMSTYSMPADERLRARRALREVEL